MSQPTLTEVLTRLGLSHRGYESGHSSKHDVIDGDTIAFTGTAAETWEWLRDEGMVRTHMCKDGVESFNETWWENDAQGIPLCRVCEDCEDEKLSRYRPEILTGYDQSDVDEPIEPEEG